MQDFCNYRSVATLLSCGQATARKKSQAISVIHAAEYTLALVFPLNRATAAAEGSDRGSRRVIQFISHRVRHCSGGLVVEHPPHIWELLGSVPSVTKYNQFSNENKLYFSLVLGFSEMNCLERRSWTKLLH